MSVEALIVLRTIKLLVDQVREIVRQNQETAKICEGLVKDMFVVELVVSEIQRSGVTVNPTLQKSLEILSERLAEVKDSLDSLGDKQKKWVHKIFGSKQMLKQAEDAHTKLSDQLEVLPAAFEAQRFAQDQAVKDASNHLSMAIDFFVSEKTANAIWKSFDSSIADQSLKLNPPFKDLYLKLANELPHLLDQKFDDEDSKGDTTAISEAIGVESGHVPLVKFSKWIEGKSLETAVAEALLRKAQAEFHRRRKKLLCPDLEIFWVGNHLAEWDNREVIRKCFEDLVGGTHTFNVTFAASIPEAQKLLEAGSRLIGQMASGRVIIITTIAMERRLRKMIDESKYSKAKVVKDQNKSDSGVTEMKGDNDSAVADAPPPRIVVYHRNYQSYQKNLFGMIDKLPQYITIGPENLKQIIMTSGSSLKLLDEAQTDEINNELEKLSMN